MCASMALLMTSHPMVASTANLAAAPKPTARACTSAVVSASTMTIPKLEVTMPPSTRAEIMFSTILREMATPSATLPSVALGVAISLNMVENMISARVEGGMVTSNFGIVIVEAETTAEVHALAVGLGAAAKFAVEATIGWDVMRSAIDAHISKYATD